LLEAHKPAVSGLATLFSKGKPNIDVENHGNNHWCPIRKITNKWWDFHIYVSLQLGIHFFMPLIFLLKMQLETQVRPRIRALHKPVAVESPGPKEEKLDEAVQKAQGQSQ